MRVVSIEGVVGEPMTEGRLMAGAALWTNQQHLILKNKRSDFIEEHFGGF